MMFRKIALTLLTVALGTSGAYAKKTPAYEQIHQLTPDQAALVQKAIGQEKIVIKEIQQRLGMTVLYVTHDQEEAMNMSDRIAIMNHGRIEQLGPPGLIYERPSNAFVGRFLGEANLVEGTIERIAQGVLPALKAAHKDPIVLGWHIVDSE